MLKPAPSQRTPPRSRLNIVVYRAPDLADEWIGHCLELDLISQGSSPAQALDMVAEAIELVARDNVAAGRPALIFRQAPPEIVALLDRGEPIATRILRLPTDGVEQPVELSSRVSSAR